MKRLFSCVLLVLLIATAGYAAKKKRMPPVEKQIVEEQMLVDQLIEERKVNINDLVGRTIEYTWKTGPFKDAAHVLTFVDPNTMKLSIESGSKMTNSSTISFQTIQVTDHILILTWRSEEYGSTVVLTLNFDTHMMYEVAVSEKSNYLSEGPFVFKKQ